ncbi:DUF1176 domain-containing protein [Enterobacteriaceae bacterium 4M9]|nr:DUF1176 domain-containing protein [Enterobacteriaceae bacterium 4M9]
MLYPLKTLLLCCLCFSAGVLAEPVQRSFSDWQVTCNNQNFCQARNTGLHQGLVMSIGRSAGVGVDATLRIELGALTRAFVGQPPIAPRLQLDGVPLVLSGRWHSGEHMLSTNDSSTIGAFLREIRDGEAITLHDGPGNLSLIGLKAALLYIDDRQQRVGNESAWLEKGLAAARSVPLVPALQTLPVPEPVTPLSKEERETLLDYAAWRMNASHCSIDPVRQQVRAWALSETSALVLVSCEAGAWNVVDLAWRVPRNDPTRAIPVQLTLPFQPRGQNRRLELMNGQFDEKTGELRTLEKSRGIGDCGVATRWRFDGQRFRLARYAAEPACDGWHGPDAWPVLWVTRQASAHLTP